MIQNAIHEEPAQREVCSVSEMILVHGIHAAFDERVRNQLVLENEEETSS